VPVETATAQTPVPATTPATTPQAGAAAVPTRVAPKWMVLNPLEYVVVKLKIAGYGGLLLALPFIIWQICAFIFPGLHPQEKRAIQVLLAGCSVLAILGVCVAYFGVFPLVLPYLMTWVPEFVDMQLRMNETLSILIKGIMGFAIAFQFPMGVLVLVYMDLLTPQNLKEFRKVAIIGMAVISAVFTPPDPISMLIMLIPLALLYEMSIILAQLMVWRRKKKAPDAV
jgi:sec-independent protein translocase protein TatC